MGASRRAYWHSWAVTLNFEAPDEKAAESPRAAKSLMLSEWQRKRLLVRERL